MKRTASISTTETLARRRIPTQKRARARVDQILEAAATLLEKDPMEKLTAAAIAGEAGIPVGSLYQYFPNKLAVIAELVRRVMAEADREILTALQVFADLDWRDGIDRAVDAALQTYGNRPDYVQALLSLRPTPEFGAITAESNERIARLLAERTKLRELALPEERIILIARTAIEAANVLQDWALSSDSDAEMTAIGEEMKTMMKAYIGHYVTTVGLRNDVASVLPR